MSRSLDPRLRAAAQAVREGAVAADIGTDHGYLICELVGSGKCPRGFACDIRPGPLSAAQRYIGVQNLGDRIQTRLTNGLQGLPGTEIDDIIIAGMGGELIGEILTAVPWTRDRGKRFVLQPMTRDEHLRRLLYCEGFSLLNEHAVVSGRFVYTVMTAAYSGERLEVGELFAHTGLLQSQDDAAAQRYRRALHNRLYTQAAGLARSKRDSDRARAAEQFALTKAIMQGENSIE